MIYPTLTLLEELGYVTASPEPGGTRKLHDITPEGRAFLAANEAAVEALLARMAEAAERHGGEPAPQILRAMENLKLALRLRLGRGRPSEDTANAIAAALDEAARRGGAELMPAEPWAVAEARFPTAAAGRYLGQLCAHFGHRIPAVREGDRGSLEFPDGICTLEADAEALRLRLAATDAAALARLEEVVGRHLLRFAFREAAALEWRTQGATA